MASSTTFLIDQEAMLALSNPTNKKYVISANPSGKEPNGILSRASPSSLDSPPGHSSLLLVSQASTQQPPLFFSSLLICYFLPWSGAVE